jgi:hypothetical protein
VLPKTVNIALHVYKTIIFPAVLYGSEFYSFTLRGKHGLRMSENRLLRTAGLKGEEVPRGGYGRDM